MDRQTRLKPTPGIRLDISLKQWELPDMERLVILRDVDALAGVAIVVSLETWLAIHYPSTPPTKAFCIRDLGAYSVHPQ